MGHITTEFNVIFLNNDTLCFHGFSGLGNKINVTAAGGRLIISAYNGPKDTEMHFELTDKKTDNNILKDMIERCSAAGKHFLSYNKAYYQTDITVEPEYTI